MPTQRPRVMLLHVVNWASLLRTRGVFLLFTQLLTKRNSITTLGQNNGPDSINDSLLYRNGSRFHTSSETKRR